LLVVDDEPELLYAVQALLAAHHDVVTVGSGREALDMLQRDDRFDVVLCDLMMPEVPGMAVYEELDRRGQREVLDRVVFMTGGAFTESGRRFIGRVTNTCLEKPFDGYALLHLVATRVGL
jgi:CheY-like chemotaxis protein